MRFYRKSKVVVNQSELSEVLAYLKTKKFLALDTETTGLRWYHEDRLFSLIIADERQSYYFNFQNYPGVPMSMVLDRGVFDQFKPLFSEPGVTYAMHNSKFDMAMLAKEGLFLNGVIHDTLVMARVEYNEHLNYSLEACAERIGLKKNDEVEKYISKHHLWEWEQIPGKKTRTKRLFFDQVPFELIHRYAEQDARVTYDLAVHQSQAFKEIADKTPQGVPTLLQLAEMESKLTHVCFAMERTGILIDREYCVKAIQHEAYQYAMATQEFETLTGMPFKDSNQVLAKAFTEAGEKYPMTEKGNPSFTDDVLEGLKTPLAQVVQRYRAAYKRANTYYRNFFFYADQSDRIHANIKQAGTGTGRFSYSEPNLQNLNKEEDNTLQFKVRRAFIPTPGYCFVSIDYAQLEYRLMADYANEAPLIAKIKAGMDVHEATAEMMGVSRKEAKTLNFMLLYGGGAQKLADALELTLEKAQALKRKYFKALPMVQEFIRNVMRVAETRGYIRNAYGRLCYFPDASFAYKAPNYLIQGTGGDTAKLGMIKIHEFFKGKKSRLLVNIHDEILAECHESELHLVPEMVEILRNVYPYKRLPMDCSVSHSRTSWADLVDGPPK